MATLSVASGPFSAMVEACIEMRFGISTFLPCVASIAFLWGGRPATTARTTAAAETDARASPVPGVGLQRSKDEGKVVEDDEGDGVLERDARPHRRRRRSSRDKATSHARPHKDKEAPWSESPRHRPGGTTDDAESWCSCTADFAPGGAISGVYGNTARI